MTTWESQTAQFARTVPWRVVAEDTSVEECVEFVRVLGGEDGLGAWVQETYPFKRDWWVPRSQHVEDWLRV